MWLMSPLMDKQTLLSTMHRTAVWQLLRFGLIQGVVLLGFILCFSPELGPVVVSGYVMGLFSSFLFTGLVWQHAATPDKMNLQEGIVWRGIWAEIVSIGLYVSGVIPLLHGQWLPYSICLPVCALGALLALRAGLRNIERIPWAH